MAAVGGVWTSNLQSKTGGIVTQSRPFCYHRIEILSASRTPLTLVVGSDGSADSERAIEWATTSAALHPGSTIHLLEALALPATPHHSWKKPPEEVVADAERKSRQRLERSAAAISARNVAAEVHVRRWLPVDSIVELADEVRADLVVVGRHGHASAFAHRVLIGSVSGDVSRTARTPVAVVRGTSPHRVPPRRILLALDASEPSLAAARAVARIFPGAPVLAVSVAHGAEGLAREAIERAALAAGIDAGGLEVERAEGDPAQLLLERAAAPGIDLAAAGRRGHGPLGDLLVGGVAEKLLQLSPCPILLAH
jgi:nucleotide-binding universal stress UspA family protein